MSDRAEETELPGTQEEEESTEEIAKEAEDETEDESEDEAMESDEGESENSLREIGIASTTDDIVLDYFRTDEGDENDDEASDSNHPCEKSSNVPPAPKNAARKRQCLGKTQSGCSTLLNAAFGPFFLAPKHLIRNLPRLPSLLCSLSKDANARRLLLMLILTISFGIAEFVTGIITDSLAMMADAFHMASDAIGLIIGLIALQVAKRQSPSHRFSYGWGRAEVIGGLVNGVFLLSVCFFIVLEAVQRFIELPEITEPLFLTGVGVAGLLINIFGMLLFLRHAGAGGHGHSHGGGGGGHGHSHEGSNEKKSTEEDKEKKSTKGKEKKKKKPGRKRNQNLYGVFLHVMGDALGSVAVVITGLLVYFVADEWEYIYYADPILSLVTVMIIVRGSVPLVIATIGILAQSVPPGVQLEKLKSELEDLPEVYCVHDLHLWQMVAGEVVGSIHLELEKGKDFMDVGRKCKRVFHSYGVHKVTIQPEFRRKRSKKIKSKVKASSGIQAEGGVRNRRREKTCRLACTKECTETRSLIPKKEKEEKKKRKETV